MSLILEALRKSEAERRRGQAPDLFDTPVVRPQPTAVATERPVTRVSPHLVIGGAGALLATALGLWWAMRGDEPARLDAMEPADSHQPPAEVADALGSTRIHTPAPPVLAVVPQAAPGTAPRPVDGTGSAAPAVAATPAGRATARTAPAPAPSPAVSPRPSAAGNAGTPAQVSTRLPAPPVTAAAPVLPASPPAPVPGGDARDAGVLRLADLAADERRQLPTLKMSMHMWAPDRAQRFVILDGARMAEGDRIGDAIIETITADGAVLAWRGRQLKVPVR